MHNNDSKSLSHHGVRIWGNGGMVTGSVKAIIFPQVWSHFMHLDTITKEVQNIKHVYLHVFSVTRPI